MKTPLLDGIKKESRLSPATIFKLKEGLGWGGGNALTGSLLGAPAGAAIGTVWGALADPREGEDRRQTVKRHLLRGLAAGAIIPATAGLLGGATYGWKRAIPNLRSAAADTGFAPWDKERAFEAAKILKSLGI